MSITVQVVGISPENLIHLFEKYSLVNSATGVHVSDAGLRLPITRVIIEAHPSWIWVETKLVSLVEKYSMRSSMRL